MKDKLNLLIKEFLLDLEKLRRRRVKTIRQKNDYEKDIDTLVDDFTDKYLGILLPELQREYLKSVNKVIKGVSEIKGKDIQKKKFKKSSVPKELDTSSVERRFKEKMASMKFMNKEFKKREIAAYRLFNAN